MKIQLRLGLILLVVVVFNACTSLTKNNQIAYINNQNTTISSEQITLKELLTLKGIL